LKAKVSVIAKGVDDADSLLYSAIGQLEDVVIVGHVKDSEGGEIRMFLSSDDGYLNVWLLAMAKHMFLDKANELYSEESE